MIEKKALTKEEKAILALNEKEEFAIYSERNVSEITIDDYLAYKVEQFQPGSLGTANEIEIVSNTNRPVNIVFTDTNKTVTGKFAEMEVKNEQRIMPPDLRSFQLLSIVNEGDRPYIDTRTHMKSHQRLFLLADFQLQYNKSLTHLRC